MFNVIGRENHPADVILDRIEPIQPAQQDPMPQGQGKEDLMSNSNGQGEGVAQHAHNTVQVCIGRHKCRILHRTLLTTVIACGDARKGHLCIVPSAGPKTARAWITKAFCRTRYGSQVAINQSYNAIITINRHGLSPPPPLLFSSFSPPLSASIAKLHAEPQRHPQNN